MQISIEAIASAPMVIQKFKHPILIKLLMMVFCIKTVSALFLFALRKIFFVKRSICTSAYGLVKSLYFTPCY